MSGFIVSARKYRPTRFEDVVGQGHVVKTLKNAIRNDQLAHSFLFTGPRGVGKTTCARILARIINADDPVAAADEAPDAASLEGANPFNIYEIDAASNNSVEDIRTLTEQVRFPPQSGKYKVFIIDEVHMLSQAAFNAFLKTLEEPPPYAVFILATTEKHKIIPTILSRCQIFDFSRIRVPEIVAHLEKISTAEGVTYEDDGLHIIAQKADGALRDALSMYDRILSYTGGSITLQEVLDNLNILDYDYFFGLTDAFLTEDLSRVLHTYNEILDKGFEGDAFLTGIAEHFRNLLVARDPATLDLLELTGPLKARYREQAALCSPSFLVSALGVMNTCDIHYKAAKHKRLHVEMSLVKLTYLQRAVGVATEPAPAKKKPSPELAVEPISAKTETPTPAAKPEAEASTPVKPEPRSEPQPAPKAESVEPPVSEMKTAPAMSQPEPASDPILEEEKVEAAEAMQSESSASAPELSADPAVESPEPSAAEQSITESTPPQEDQPESVETEETVQAPESREAEVPTVPEKLAAGASPNPVADQSEVAVAASEPAAETATAEAESAPAASPRKVVDLPTSQSGIRVPTLADLARQVDEEKQQAEQEYEVLEVEGKRTLSPDVLEAGWKAFGEAIAGEKMAVAKLVEAARLEAHDAGLRILVENSIQQELIREELPGYRAHLPSHGKGAGSIQVEVKPSDQPASARVPYTSKERLERMAEKNPELNNLQQTLGLDFDY